MSGYTLALIPFSSIVEVPTVYSSRPPSNQNLLIILFEAILECNSGHREFDLAHKRRPILSPRRTDKRC